MFNINQRQMEKMMKQMGMETQEIPAEEVIIRTKDKEIIISEPKVTKMKMAGKENFQITGEVTERGLEKEKGFSDEDVKMVAEKTGASIEDAKKALEDTGDLAEAILKLKKE